MVEIADIKDRRSLEAWLRDQPRKVVVWIAFRAAARVLPIWWQAVLAQEWALKNELSALPPLRNLLISQVATVTPTDDIRISAAAAAEIGVIGVAFNAAVEADGAARGALSAVAAKDTVFRAASLAAFKSTRAVSGADATVWQAIKTDAAEAVGGPIPIGMSLWPANARPLEGQWSEIKTQVAASPDAADWQFWIDWYETLLKGRTMVPDPVVSWEMLEQIALIDPETWDAGPEVVNPKIREIWELYRLRAEVAALQAEKEAFLAARASHEQRSHNQPPEGLVDDQPEVARQITIVWDSLDEARDELEQDTPDKSRLRNIAHRLLSALNVIVRYCGSVVDTAVMAAAKVGGGAVGTAILDHVANNGRLMQFAKDLLTYGGG